MYVGGRERKGEKREVSEVGGRETGWKGEREMMEEGEVGGEEESGEREMTVVEEGEGLK